MLGAGGDRSISREALFVKSVKIKLKGKSAPKPPKVLPRKPSELRRWPAIAQFLGMPISTVHRWAKEGMPVRREGRNVVASPEELNQWLQRTSGEAAGVHVVTPGADLLKDLRASVAAQAGTQNSSRVF
jgi:predicted DNA-binding transcriptional regulator AlpA